MATAKSHAFLSAQSVLLVSLMGCVSLAGAQTLAESLAGCYSTRWVADRQHPDFHVGESLVLVAQEGGGLRFNYNVVGANGHLGVAEGIAKPTSDPNRFEFVAAQTEGSGTGNDIEFACAVQLTATRRMVSVKSIGECASYFGFGARAGWGGDFKRNTRERLGVGYCQPTQR